MIRTEKKPKEISFLTAGKRGRPPSGREKVTLMLSSDVVAKFKAADPENWRTLIDAHLRRAAL